MAVLTKDQIPEPVLPKETVELSALNGEVIVQALTLSQRIRLFEQSRDRGVVLADLLELTVVDAKGDPIYTHQQWELFGARHFNEALNLYQVASKLSGLDVDLNVKN